MPERCCAHGCSRELKSFYKFLHIRRESYLLIARMNRGMQVAALETSDCQNGIRRADPCVLVWSSESLTEQQRLFHGRGMRGVSCVEFSSSGKTLVSICTDDSHTMYVWSWQRSQCLLSRKTRAGAAPDVCAVTWSPYTADELCTFGINHVFFWKLLRKPEKESLQVLSHMLSSCFAVSI
jgi:hypothetical protein